MIENKENLGKQIDRLAKYIMENYPQELKGEGAIDTAIQIMAKNKNRMTEFAGDCVWKALNPKSKMCTPNTVYIRIEKELKNWKSLNERAKKTETNNKCIGVGNKHPKSGEMYCEKCMLKGKLTTPKTQGL